ncbi:MAG: DUF5677 domain-containing protein [Proteobacteria bacterium]|nr:DUF5677 domain-containing protein [Pseudomonadota bacterium]
MQTNEITFGFPDEWQAFLKRHPRFAEKLHPLSKTLQSVFIREVETSKPADQVVFFLGRLCVEDFMEILLLCGNGYGIGGMKLLRGLYERAVTLGYIAKKPDKAEQFLEYHYVNQGRQFNHANEVFPMDKHLSSEQIEQIQSEYKRTKEKYQEVLCKKCGITRTRFSWSELDLQSMAREAGLCDLYLMCYYDPTLQAHATISSLIARTKLKENGQMTFDEGAQHEKAKLALIGAHNIILYVLDVVNKYFKMGLEDEVQERFADFNYIWG